MAHAYATQFDTAESTEAYRTLTGALDPVSKMCLEAHAERISVWHRLLTLHYLTIYGRFTGVPLFAFSGDPTELVAVGAWNLRHTLLGSVGRFSRCAMDNALTGYYSESAAISRIVVESWTQAAYLKLEPQAIERWRPSPERRGNAAIPKFQSMIARLHRESSYKWAVRNAETVFANCSEGSHPTSFTIGQVRKEVTNDQMRQVYAPIFNSDNSQSVINWGVLALLLSVWELANLERQPSEWHEEWNAVATLLKEHFPESWQE